MSGDVLTIIDGHTVHRIPLAEVRFASYASSPAFGPPHVIYKLKDEPERMIVCYPGTDGPGIGDVSGSDLALLIGTGALRGVGTGVRRLRRIADTMSWSYGDRSLT